MPRRATKLTVIGYDGRFELGSREVDDPLERGARLNAAVNIKHDVILNMFARKDSRGERFINEAQYRAGNHFLRLVEHSGGNMGLSVDPTREPVDGKGDSSGIIDRRIKAALELMRVKQELGVKDYNLARSVICSNADLYSFAHDQSERQRRYIAMRFKDILTTLSISWGYSTGNKKTA